MESNILDSIIENLVHILPLIHKKLLKANLEAVNKDIVRPHFAIMGTLNELGTLPVSIIGEKLLIPKPQMTHFLDKLTSLGIVERLPDARDRRIINVVLTNKGKTVLGGCKELIRDNIRKKLAYLKDDELEELSVSLRKLRGILLKLEEDRPHE